MNALEIVFQVRAYNADIVLEEHGLVIRGTGSSLPDDLQAAVFDHRAELMIALGAPWDRAVASILAEIRPKLSPVLQELPDHKLLVLVNTNIMNAWFKSIRGFDSIRD